MTAPATPQIDHRRGTGTKILATVAILAFAGAFFTIASLALFTDQEAVDNNAFSTGTIDLTAAPTTAAVTMSAMAPGDQVTAPLTIANGGTLDFRYSASSTTTENVLASELVLTMKTGVVTCDDANWAATGTPVYSGPLGSTTATALFGDPTQGVHPGDRTLAAGTNEVICVNVTLPLAATNAAQGLSTTATFTFDAEQTANNP